MAKPVYDEVFFAAVIDNQVSLVKEMLADRPFIVNGVAPFGLGSVVALDIAAMQNFLEMARVLIENGADVEGNRKNKSSVPPLLSALASKHADMAMFLISAGANIKARAPGGMTALHWAVVIPDTYLVERLLSMGAKVDPTNLDGMTPLHFAAANGYTASVRVLVANGADTSATVKGRTALELAAERGHWDVVQVLRNHERNQK
jgi:ankyrin repeat protein